MCYYENLFMHLFPVLYFSGEGGETWGRVCIRINYYCIKSRVDHTVNVMHVFGKEKSEAKVK